MTVQVQQLTNGSVVCFTSVGLILQVHTVPLILGHQSEVNQVDIVLTCSPVAWTKKPRF